MQVIKFPFLSGFTHLQSVYSASLSETETCAGLFRFVGKIGAVCNCVIIQLQTALVYSPGYASRCVIVNVPANSQISIASVGSSH